MLNFMTIAEQGKTLEYLDHETNFLKGLEEHDLVFFDYKNSIASMGHLTARWDIDPIEGAIRAWYGEYNLRVILRHFSSQEGALEVIKQWIIGMLHLERQRLIDLAKINIHGLQIMMKKDES